MLYFMEKLHRFRAALIGIAVLLGGLHASAQQKVSASYVPTIYGIVLNSSAWPNSDPQFGVYSFMPNQSVIVSTLEHQDRWLRANSGGVWFDGRLYYMNSLQGSGGNVLNMYQCWDTDSWTMVHDVNMEASESAKMAADLTYDPITKQVYGFFFTDDGTAYELGTMEFSDASPVKHSLKRAPIDMVAIAASPEGDIYGIGVNGFLYKFDKSTGDATIVGNTGVSVSAYRQSATFDFRSGKLYWAAMINESSSALFEVNTTTGKATRLGAFANSEEVVALYIPFGLADDQAPSQAENIVVDFPEGNLTGNVSFTIPTENYAMEPLTGSVDYTIFIDNEESKTGSSTVGATVSEQLTLTEGNHTFTVVLKNAHGESPKSKLTAYIGFDTPVAPENVQLTINNDSYEAKLTWDTPERGVNNGYIDKDNMRYIIKRYPGPVTLETDYEGNSYFDELPEQTGLRSYRYTVQPYYGDKVGNEATTPTINVGKAQEIPWREDFADPQSFSQFTVIDANNDNWTWVYNRSSHSPDCQNNDLYNSNDDDDWLITPPLHLLGDRTYDLEFEASSNWAWDRAGQEQLEVGFGDNASALNYEWVVERRIIQQAEEKIPVKVTAKLRPAKDGTYFVGFHAVTPLANAFHLYIHNIQVVESSLLTSPDSVTNLQLEPAAKGALRATIRFNAPTKDLAGDALTTLTQIQVMRDNAEQEVIATFNAPQPGQELSYEDTKAVNGLNTYIVLPLAGDHKGQASRISGWVGIDYPDTPQNISARLEAGSIKLTWDAPDEVGLNGGYVDSDDLFYQVYDKTGQLLPGAGELYDCEFTVSGITLTGAQATNQYYVLPVSELGEGNPGVSNVVVTGDPYQMPLEESFANGASHYLWWMTQGSPYYTFSMTRQESSDNDGGALYMPGSEYYPSVWAQIGSGKISMVGSEHPMWSFSYFPYVGHKVVLTAKVQTPDNVEHEAAVIDFSKLSGANEWRKQVVDLSPYKDQEWVIVMIHAVIYGNSQVTIDDISVKEAAAYDLAAGIYAPKTMRIGMPKDVKLTVRNKGIKMPTNYSVRLFANDTEVGEQQGKAIASLDSTTFVFPYQAAVNSPAEVRFYGVVDFADDQDLSDNTTATTATAILQPTLPGVQNFGGQAAGGQVTLSWQAPDLEQAKTVTDDFEDYSSWLTEGFGEWQVIDQDGGRTYDMKGVEFPNQTLPMAFILYNNDETVGTQYSAMKPHSGSQYAASFDAIASRTSLRRSADWLISPELSGQAQTIKFFARSVTESYLEKMEVAYTTGSALTRSAYVTLKTVDGVPNAWTEYEVQLPEGAKYFAIRNVSADMMALIVDDVTYEPMPLVLTGYDVYVDGQKAGSTEATTFTTAGDDNHAYQVVAVYTKGESALSTIFGSAQGIDYTLVDIDLDQADLTVYTVDGIKVAEGPGAYRSLKRGVYVVSKDGRSYRVVKR